MILVGLALISFAAISAAQTSAPANNTVTMEELNAIDQRLHKELDAAQDAFDREKFIDAEQGFAQLATEVDDLLRRIAASVFPKNGTLEIDGVKKPATVQTESEWFGRLGEKANRGKAESAILVNVSAIQREADGLLRAGKYPDGIDTYRKSAQVLTADKSVIGEATFRFFMDRAGNGERSAISGYWSTQFKVLRDRYNSTIDSRMSPGEIRKTIQSVADEIRSQGYLDHTRHMDMPEDARTLFKTLAYTAESFLAQ